MITSASSFVNSTISVSQNAVKNIVFRCAALLLQIAVYKSFSLLAFKSKTFTSYLMFSEDYIQKAFFVFSRGFSRQSILVLILAILLAAAGWYDTLLWGLDAPGYIAQRSNVTSSSIADDLLQDPAYILFSSSEPGAVSPLDAHITDTMGANLFKVGVNFTLTGELHLGNRSGVPATTYDLRPSPGPRIWLDDQGFSVSPDTYVTFASTTDRNVSDSLNCPWYDAGEGAMHWDCRFNNSFSLSFARDEILGRPEIHWDDATDGQYMSQYLRSNREDNPWTSLGTGGDTALMKQMFTLIKGNQRHTFIETAWKTSMVLDYDEPLPVNEIQDLITRSWSTNKTEQENPLLTTITLKIKAARDKNSSYMFGGNSGTPYSVSQYNYELLNVETFPGVVGYSLFRISLVNITLTRSDTLPQAVTPFESCNNFYQNEATGGKVRGTDCYKSMGGNQKDHHFFGQVDTSAVLILNGLLGDGSFNVSSKALNQKGFEWYVDNDERLNSLLLSRGYIMAIDEPGSVTIELAKLKAAMSYLQVTLIVLAAVLAVASWLCLRAFASTHYSSSLLANLFATTSVTAGAIDTSHKPKYLRKIPDIQLKEEDSSRVVMQTVEPAGVFQHEKFPARGMQPYPAYNSGLSGAGMGDKWPLAVSQHAIDPTPIEERPDQVPFLADGNRSPHWS